MVMLWSKLVLLGYYSAFSRKSTRLVHTFIYNYDFDRCFFCCILMHYFFPKPCMKKQILAFDNNSKMQNNAQLCLTLS